jgi:hypothetical protein
MDEESSVPSAAINTPKASEDETHRSSLKDRGPDWS